MTTTRLLPPAGADADDTRFRELVEESPVGIGVITADRILYMNRIARRWFGASHPEELLQRSPWDLVHPDDQESVRQYLAEAAAGTLSGRVSLKYRRLDGETVFLDAEGWPIHYAGVDAVRVTYQDATERLAAEHALRENEERLRLTIDRSPVGIALTEPGGATIRLNQAVCDLIGYSEEEMRQRRFQDITHPDDRAETDARYVAMFSGEYDSFRHEYRCIRKDGEVVWVALTAAIIRDQDDNPLHILTHMQDITEAKRAENALRESEERYRLTFNGAPTGIALVGLDGRILRVNDAIVRMTNYTAEELTGSRFQELTHGDDLDVNLTYFRELTAGERDSYQMEKRYVRRDGSPLWTRVLTALVRDTDGRPLHMVGHVEDITQAREAEEARRESERRFRATWETSADGLRLIDANGTIVMVNDAYCRMIGRPAEELVGRSFTTVYQDPESAVGDMHRHIQEREIQPYLESHIRLWNGREFWFEASNALIEREGLDPLLLSSFRDVTERKRTTDALRRYRLLAEHSNDIMLFVRPDGSILEANRAAERAYGYPREELAAMSLRNLIEPSDARGDDLRFLRDAREGSVFPARHRRRSGRPFPVELSVQSAEIGGECIYLAVVRDTTERVALERQLRHQAFHDPLTKLPNRLLFMDRLEQAILRRDGCATILFLDLDRFKNINDSLGHSAGDQLLVAVAGRLKACIRAADTAARLGGDEFTILLDGCDTTGEATRTATRILRKLEAPFEINGQEVFASASIGVAVGRSGGASAEDLLREADLAMYQAKTSGKARHAVFVRERAEDMRGRLQLETDLRRAIERGEFQVYYQPIVLMEARRTIGVEALTRWHHPRFGLMPPDEFVPLQEQIGMIEPFTMWVLNEAQQQCLELQKHGMPVSVSVNLSPYNLHEPDFAARVGEMLRESGLAPHFLKLEITESAIMTNPERALRILSTLNDMGVRLSMDDFGTGYSSLTYLKQLPVHEIKIDKSFVIGMDANDEDDAAIVRATIDLAHNLRKKVVAEGVESAEVWNLLNVLGCDAAQGFHMSPPLPALDLIPWLKASAFGLGKTARRR